MTAAVALAVGIAAGLLLYRFHIAAWRSTMGGKSEINTEARSRVLAGMDDERLERLAHAVASEMSRRPRLASGWDLGSR